MKGIVLAGGTGSRLWPITKGVSKQLLPVYDKPLIHYPLGTLFLAGVRDILIITTPDDKESFVRLLGDGSQYGANFSYETQENPKGIAEAFIIGEKFIANESVVLILGDNIFYGSGLGEQIRSVDIDRGATILACKVKDPERYGVVTFDSKNKVISIEEKPLIARSNYAVPGLYFYDNQVSDIAKKISPSKRGELEITSINDFYLQMGLLNVKVLARGTAWLDCGTVESLHDASSFIRVVEERQGRKISCLEEIAFRNSWITGEELLRLADFFGSNPYGSYLRNILLD